MPWQKLNYIKLVAVSVIAAILLCSVSCNASQSRIDGGQNDGSNIIYSSVDNTHSAVGADVNVSARAAVLMLMDSGQVIYSKNADQRLPMASTTKIMTALVALENCDVSRQVTVSPEAVGIEGSSIYLFAGERITMEDLLYALLLSSANDAAAAIAIEVGGSIEGFARMMNDRARELGLVNTSFKNPHGLDDEEHYTTARELAIIARAAMEDPTFASIVSTYKHTSAMTDTDGARLFVNHNKLLRGYEGACGIKTGFTKRSGRCLVSCAERDGLRLLCVTLDAPDDWRDHAAMLDHGFSLYSNKTLCQKQELRYTLPVVGGEQNCVTVTNPEEANAIIARYGSKIERFIELPRFVFAEVYRGQTLGYVIYKIDGHEVAQCPLVAQYSVARKIYKKSIFSIFG